MILETYAILSRTLQLALYVGSGDSRKAKNCDRWIGGRGWMGRRGKKKRKSRSTVGETKDERISILNYRTRGTPSFCHMYVVPSSEKMVGCVVSKFRYKSIWVERDRFNLFDDHGNMYEHGTNLKIVHADTYCTEDSLFLFSDFSL